ncbi:TMEM165/GDT1 family protein [Crassaminicella indica]|uniref:GDT1 family protein n=1 Tax=Crassaminicella indica TaxID=2855394 RepID=A0ABX8RDL1_9CLOT|nr:TMEM165/GDT1 family protein [Crassaminicella indica]QXM06851.1 TMEM165/GDT1 family protein [Crassaminicella indica]
MLQEFIRSLFLIFIAEMGDKTQILAMAFATRFKVYQVLLGVFIGSFLNHGIAVALGTYLSKLISINTIQIIAGFLFVGFALWTLKMDEEDEEENKGKNYGPVLTVALAFFIGELGDKTQLTAITLSVDANFPIFVLLGTVSGMVFTSALGIFVGSKIGEKVSEFTMKWVAASIFMFFGIEKLYKTLPEEYLTTVNISIFFIVIIVSIYLLLKPALKARKRRRLF